MKKRTQMIYEKERRGDRACEMVSFTLEHFFFYSSHTALLPFAISFITHELLLLRSSQKKYYSIFGFSLQHLYVVISPQASCPLVFFHTPFFFGSICVEGLMPSNQLHFFWKKIPGQTYGLFYR